MKALDWLYHIYYYTVLPSGSRVERALFLLWLLTSFLYITVIYFLFILIEFRIGKSVFIPLWIGVFITNYVILRLVYIKKSRSLLVREDRLEIKGSSLIITKIVAILAVFVAVALALVCTFYYGKHITFK